MDNYIRIREEVITKNGDITFRSVDVPMEENMFKAIAGMTDSYRRRMHERGLCCCPRKCSLFCDEDCLNCQFHVFNDDYSLDYETADAEGDVSAFADYIRDLSPSPQELFEETELHSALMSALSSLTAREREIVELQLAGLSFADIARKLGVSKAAVSKRYSTAVDKLREKMKNFSEEG